jgi:hypothetical protein
VNQKKQPLTKNQKDMLRKFEESTAAEMDLTSLMAASLCKDNTAIAQREAVELAMSLRAAVKLKFFELIEEARAKASEAKADPLESIMQQEASAK